MLYMHYNYSNSLLNIFMLHMISYIAIYSLLMVMTSSFRSDMMYMLMFILHYNFMSHMLLVSHYMLHFHNIMHLCSHNYHLLHYNNSYALCYIFIVHMILLYSLSLMISYFHMLHSYNTVYPHSLTHHFTYILFIILYMLLAFH